MPACSAFQIPLCALLVALLATAIPARAEEGPREVILEEKAFDKLANHDVSQMGDQALAIDPAKWKHAETENFIIHYRRVTEARKVAREIEYDLWFIAKTLEAKKEDYARKSHVFVFEDDAEWTAFVQQTKAPQWAASYALGDELFLNVRRSLDANRFNSQTLAHEATHAVVARLYPRKPWPLWLNEGFAEYMGGASVAARKNQTVKRQQQSLGYAELPLDKLTALTEYPEDRTVVAQLYQTSEKVVRFLMSEFPQDRFPKFIQTALEEPNLQSAILEVYGDRIRDWTDFERKYERFSR